MRECLRYPSKQTFSRVIGLSNRPLSREAAHVPDDPRLEIHSGLDLTDGNQTNEKLGSIPNIGDVTHVYFVGEFRPTSGLGSRIDIMTSLIVYTGHGGDPKEIVKLNAAIVDNTLIALNKLCLKIEFFVLQTGGKVS